MVVKAVYLEIVSDMITDAFLNVFKHFISRRDKPANVYSDNFVGANRELEKCRELFSLEQERRKIIDYTVGERMAFYTSTGSLLRRIVREHSEIL